ncbi:uncharacterized protein [Miscanthus floridulus]|uniref:uncharacterized protein n=1 Tax=Miscanthus floridulus TaxID=154761 RepID=UPI003458CE17
MAGSSVDPLEELWSTMVPALVLLSFMMQVTLLLTAEFRRRLDKFWLRAFVWSAYMLADWAAIYALGHLSVANGPGQGQHHLMLLWAPFLLVHLGGQDNITAYALEDNRLWLRHLQALAVQAAAAAYVLYSSWSSSSSTGKGGGGEAVLRFRQASVVLYVVGILKYGERVAALWWASSSPLGNNYLSLEHYTEGWQVTQDTIDTVLSDLTTHLRGEAEAEKKLLLLAHLLLNPIKAVKADELYKVAERQLSLMHDILYTKAPVIKNSMYGFCIRIVSGAGTAAAFVLFHQGLMQVLMRRPGAGGENNHYYCGRRHCNRADVAVTYVLLVGAVVLEGLAMVATVCSTWTELASDPVWRVKRQLMRATPRPLLSRVVRVFLRRHYWSETMGQLNLLELCVRSRSSCWSKGAKLLGLEDWWNTMVYSRSTRVTKTVEGLVMDLAAHLNPNGGGQSSSGPSSSAAAARFFDSSVRRGALLEGLHLKHESGDAQKRLSLVGSRDCDMDETILVWHIATDIYRRFMDPKPDGQMLPLAEAIQALSNYMLFLLAARPGMLPASANRNRYVEMCYCLITGVKCDSPQGLAAILRDRGSKEEEARAQLPLGPHQLKDEDIDNNDTLKNGCWLGARLLHQHAHTDDGSILKIVAQVWGEILCYAGHRCSGYSHAERLSNGGELVTVAAIVMEYVKTDIYKKFYQGPTNTMETHV